MARIVQSLTNTQVDKAKYTPKGKNELNDGNGLFLQLYSTNKKCWRFRYYKPKTKLRTKITIGEYPCISLAQARTKRDEFRTLLLQGIDPQCFKKEQAIERELKDKTTFLAVALEWRKKKEGEIKNKTLTKYWRSLELHIFPFLADYPIQEIVPIIALKPLKRVEERNNIDMAQRLCCYINEILNFAVNGGLLPFNPCLKMGKNLKRINKQNNPHIESHQIPKLMQSISNARVQPQTKALIYFQLLTMVRPNEASRAEWQEIDFENELWTIPAEKMKAREPHIVPLSTQAIKILKDLEGITGQFKYIFPKHGDNKAPMSSATANTALTRMGYKGKQTAHGLRGLARTYLAEQNIIHEHAEACLAHKTGGNVSLAYNHATYIPQRKVIMQFWGDFIEQCSLVKTI
ncbi:tyrosine-type recombinase/integrase [Phocoenobacter skyensis]|uniref:Integrase n=1 Tax=Phocoenobacter skyensis TaxID=97481 RepID=A0A1H7X320_9PAST|nr:integrase arm-type DNA-binding domain-containing protein [Pasteurella skyensis]MDP8079575.1 tyrosine-type recombinase/integrase [Pasteurella skyensis]MDP8085524.1 tyrosine-type recombinase/integrase [Pasteurella skyensis]QLB21899.1 preprotein translocase [Pasteurella skyensis]SEM27984.1 Integrase [Pasteurella skyensis]